MTHLTLNTGHARTSPRGEVSDATIAALTPSLSPGRHPLPIPGGYEVAVTADGAAMIATVYAPGDRPLATFGVAPDDDAADVVWPVLELHYHALTDLPGLRSADFVAARRPDTTPWVAAIVILPTPAESAWLGDYERCLAWAWLESLRKGGLP